jgi:molybdenum cofactor guanylyltransferase
LSWFGNISVYIAAGGKSSRMGTDKGLMEFKGKRMIDYLTETLMSIPVPFTMISQNKAYDAIGVEVIKDIIPEKGPMGALQTALHHSPTEYILLLSCDSPFVAAMAFEHLVSKLTHQEVLVARTMSRINPLFAVYQRTIKSKVDECINRNELKMLSLIESCSYEEIDMSEIEKKYPLSFMNINTPDDVKEILKLWPGE